MKKLIAAVATALLIAVGLVGFSGSPAQAKDCPYTGCLNTKTNVSGPGSIARHKKAKFRIVVKSGNARPRGTIKFIVKRNKGGFYHARAFPYRGEARMAFTYKLHKKGKYTVVAVYIPGGNQPFNSSRDSAPLRVRKR